MDTHGRTRTKTTFLCPTGHEKIPGILKHYLAYGRAEKKPPFSGVFPFCPTICATGKEGVFLERFHHKEANFNRSQADEIGHVFIREGFEICTAAW